jgi:hypothetical protein
MTAQHIRKADELARQQGVDLEGFSRCRPSQDAYLLASNTEPESEPTRLVWVWGREYPATRYVTFQVT